MTSAAANKNLVARAAVVGIASLFVCASIAHGESRNRVKISSPGSLQQVGEGSTSSSTFNAYSSGLGALGRSASAPLGGGSALRSSVRTSLSVSSDPLRASGNTGIPNRNILNQPLGAGIQGRPGVSGLSGGYSRRIRGSSISPIMRVAAPVRSPIGNSPLATKPIYQDLTDPLALRRSSMPSAYTPTNPLRAPLAASSPAGPLANAYAPGSTPNDPLLVSDAGNAPSGGVGKTLVAQSNSASAFGLARGFVQALEQASASLLRQSDKPITTLVPQRESIYRTYMLRGDKAFRQGNYREAYANFQIANDLGDKDPESFICMLHSEFALSAVSYAKASYFLEQTLRYMPELPLANLRPRGFYESQAKYAEQLVGLQEHVRKNPADHEAMFILAYFRWFEQDRDVEGTKDLLSKALAAAERKKAPLMIDAISTFWKGMVASGAVSGELDAKAVESPQATPVQ